MSPTPFSIRFVSDDVHKIRNFGEDLARTMREQRLGSVGGIDSAIDKISGILTSRRDLGEWRKIVRRMLEKHYLAEVATVIEL
jgi:hypothetical protein